MDDEEGRKEVIEKRTDKTLVVIGAGLVVSVL
jgi:hypothetical protein